MKKYHIIDNTGCEVSSIWGRVFDTKEEAENVLEEFILGRETEDDLAEYESDPCDRLDYLMNPYDYDDFDDYEVVEIEV